MTSTKRGKKEEKKYLGGKIHSLLNKTLTRKLTRDEYTQLVLLIAGVFDLIPPTTRTITNLQEK